MKKTILILTIFSVSFFSFGQKTATYEECISKKVKGLVDHYISITGEQFNVGDTIQLGLPFREGNFNFAWQNAGIEIYPLQSTASGSFVRIKKIKLRSKTATLSTTAPHGFVYNLLISLDNALQNGEVKGKLMSSDEALAELKKWKDKLDLDLITQEQYDEKKEELSKLIK